MPSRLTLMILVLSIGCVSLARGDDTIALNEEYKGKTSVDKTWRQPRLTLDSVPIDLKGGQRLELFVKVAGNRGAGIILWNSDGEAIAISSPLRKMRGVIGPDRERLMPKEAELQNLAAQSALDMSPKTARLLIEEVPGTGTYKITVYSNLAGDYTLLAKDSTKKRDIAAVQREITATKRRLQELENELKALERKRRDKQP